MELVNNVATYQGGENTTFENIHTNAPGTIATSEDAFHASLVETALSIRSNVDAFI